MVCVDALLGDSSGDLKAKPTDKIVTTKKRKQKSISFSFHGYAWLRFEDNEVFTFVGNLVEEKFKSIDELLI